MENWPLYIKRSLALYLNGVKGDFELDLDGREDDPIDTRLTVRMHGPDFIALGGKSYRVDMEVSLLVSIKLGTDIYKEDRVIGQVSNMIRSFNILDLSDNVIGCMNQVGDITVTRFGSMKPESDVHQITVDSAYETFLEDA